MFKRSEAQARGRAREAGPGPQLRPLLPGSRPPPARSPGRGRWRKPRSAHPGGRAGTLPPAPPPAVRPPRSSWRPAGRPSPRPGTSPASPRRDWSRAAHPGPKKTTTTTRSSKWTHLRSAGEEEGRTRGRKGWWRPTPRPGQKFGGRPGPHCPRHGPGLGAPAAAAAVHPGRLGGRRASALGVPDFR